MRNAVRRTLATAAAITAVAAAPTQATVIEKGRFTDETYGFSYDCGFPVKVTGVASGNYRLRAGTNTDETAFFALNRVSFHEIHTNADTGEWFSVSGHFLENEITATRVEGSIFEFAIIKAGPVAVVKDSEGNLVAKDRGVARRTILFDTLGDQEPGGAFVDFVSLELHGPHPALGNLCDIATRLTV